MATINELLDVARSTRQTRTMFWAVQCFGVDEVLSLPQRGIRLVEEAAEAAQAVGCTREELLRVVDHVMGKPKGELSQELGGVGVGILILAAAAGLDADTCERTEVERVLGLPTEHFTARNAAKNAAGMVAGREPEGEVVDLQILAREAIAAWKRYDKDRGMFALEDLDEAMEALEGAVTPDAPEGTEDDG